MQGIHCTSDGSWVVPRLGEKRAIEGAYAWRTLLDTGAVVTNGTDEPAEDVDPMESFYATVTRRRKAPGVPAYFGTVSSEYPFAPSASSRLCVRWF